MKTNKEKIIFWLTELSSYKAKSIPSRNKYDMFEGTDSRGAIFFFVGERGAIRFGRTKNASKSISMTDTINMDKLNEKLKQLGY